MGALHFAAPYRVPSPVRKVASHWGKSGTHVRLPSGRPACCGSWLASLTEWGSRVRNPLCQWVYSEHHHRFRRWRSSVLGRLRDARGPSRERALARAKKRTPSGNATGSSLWHTARSPARTARNQPGLAVFVHTERKLRPAHHSPSLYNGATATSGPLIPGKNGNAVPCSNSPDIDWPGSATSAFIGATPRANNDAGGVGRESCRRAGRRIGAPLLDVIAR